MISVIMSVYNAEKYLSESIESILKQTFRDFEFICIDDGSTDSSLEILKKYREIDPRIVLVSRENRGLIYSLNEGLSIAKYNYIARMDADDISHPTRFEKQFKHIVANKNIAVLGCRYNYIDEKGIVKSVRKVPKKNYFIKGLMIFGSPFAHPGVLINRGLLKEELYYSHDFPCAEDYELWTRLYDTNFTLENLDEILLDYRILPNSVSRSKREIQISSQNKAKILNILKVDSCFKFENKMSFLFFLKNQKRIRYVPFQILYYLLKGSKRW
ncbi:glycosyltransferase [Vibrio cholerae]|uniref:glycosyltransferase n=1 Tax=Vibrio cholerae TaxID=666 RepID=UPI0039672A8F